jgi:hypothetical protein
MLGLVVGWSQWVSQDTKAGRQGRKVATWKTLGVVPSWLVCVKSECIVSKPKLWVRHLL